MAVLSGLKKKVFALLPSMLRKQMLDGSFSLSVSKPQPIAGGDIIAQTIVIGFTRVMLDTNDTFERALDRMDGGIPYAERVIFSEGMTLPFGTVPVRPESVSYGAGDNFVTITGTMEATMENRALLASIANLRDRVGRTRDILGELQTAAMRDNRIESSLEALRPSPRQYFMNGAYLVSEQGQFCWTVPTGCGSEDSNEMEVR